MGADDVLPGLLAGDADAVARLADWVRRAVRFDAPWVPPQDRDDLSQEAMAAVWTTIRAPGFTLTASLQALARTITVARCIDWARRRRPVEPLPDQAAAPGAAPLDALVEEARTRLLRKELLRLRDACREIIRQYYFERRSYAQIAAVLGRAEATLRVRMFHCLAELRERIGDRPKRTS